MTSHAARLAVPALAALLAVSVSLSMATGAAEPKAGGPPLAHSVFFALKDRSPESVAKFVASCHKYLSGHAGVTSFSVGVIAEDVNEGEVSVRDFDVALLAVFDSKENEAVYLKHPRHIEFVTENKANFAKVRVFDTYLAKP